MGGKQRLPSGLLIIHRRENRCWFRFRRGFRQQGQHLAIRHRVLRRGGVGQFHQPVGDTFSAAALEQGLNGIEADQPQAVSVALLL